MAKKRKKAKKASTRFIGMYTECGDLSQLTTMDNWGNNVTGATADDVRKKINEHIDQNDYSGGKYVIVEVIDVGSATQVTWTGKTDL